MSFFSTLPVRSPFRLKVVHHALSAVCFILLIMHHIGNSFMLLLNITVRPFSPGISASGHIRFNNPR